MKVLKRIFLNWRTSTLGVIGGGIIYTVLENAGCDLLQLENQAWLAVAIPVLIGASGVDKDHETLDTGETGQLP